MRRRQIIHCTNVGPSVHLVARVDLDPASADVVFFNCRDDSARPEHDPELFE